MSKRNIEISLTTFTWINFGLVALALCSAVFMIGKVRKMHRPSGPENDPAVGG